MRIENPLLALYKGYGVFQSREDFSDSLGGEPAGTSLIGAVESERYYSMSERETSSKREAPSELEVPSERDADAADYEAGHADAEFNEAAYPLSAGLDADCSCLK